MKKGKETNLANLNGIVPSLNGAVLPVIPSINNMKKIELGKKDEKPNHLLHDDIMEDLYKKRELFFQQSLKNRQNIKRIQEKRMDNERKMREEFKFGGISWYGKKYGHLRNKTYNNTNALLKRKIIENDPILVNEEYRSKPPPCLPPIYRQVIKQPAVVDLYKKREINDPPTMDDICKARYLRIPGNYVIHKDDDVTES